MRHISIVHCVLHLIEKSALVDGRAPGNVASGTCTVSSTREILLSPLVQLIIINRENRSEGCRREQNIQGIATQTRIYMQSHFLARDGLYLTFTIKAVLTRAE